jgi:hypothetical protein
MIRLMLVGAGNRSGYGDETWMGRESDPKRRRVYVGDDLCLPLGLSGQTSWLKGQVGGIHYR